MEEDQEAQEAQIREEFDNWIEQKKSKGDYLGIINALRRLYIDENIELIRAGGIV